MAQDVRSRLSQVGLLLLAVACGDGSPSPRAVDTGGLAADALVTAILDECHAPLRGRMQGVDASVTLPDGTVWRVWAVLPRRVRMQANGNQLMLLDDRVHRLPTDTPATTADELELARRLRDLVDAAALGPLHRCSTAARQPDGALSIRTTDGAEAVIELQPGTLLPQSIATGDRPPIRIAGWNRTPTTWLPNTLASAALGSCRVEFNLGGLDFADDFFAPPGTAAVAAPARRIDAPGAVRETQSPVPILVDGKALTWASVADPGSWPARVAAYRPLHSELTAQNQVIAGFPVFWEEHGERWLAAPFRRRNDGPEFVAPTGWQLRSFAAGRWLVVYPPTGDLQARLVAGERLLRQALQQYGFTPRGPITAQPYFHLHEGEPDAARLAAPVVRMAVAID